MSALALDFTEVLAFFKALSDESRLKIVGALSGAERSVDELAGLLDLRAPTVSHHLTRLKEVKLVSMRSQGTTHYYTLDVEAMRRLSKRVLALDTVAELGRFVSEDAYEQKILRDFLDGDRLKEIPASRKKRSVILSWLTRFFSEGRKYSEKEVNAIIARHHPDFATLRRELICAKLLAREKGSYWRITA
jgi:DNA-binding transcriptional ArsR family regulator